VVIDYKVVLLKRKRVTATRVSISDIVNGTFQGDDQPRLITPEGLSLSRVALVGYVSDEPFLREGFSSITVNDGTSAIRVKAWKADVVLLDGITQGTLVMVVGKVKEYEGQTYVVPEVVQVIDDPHYMELHLLQRYYTVLKQTVKSSESVASEPDTVAKKSRRKAEEPLGAQVLKYVQDNASDSGVSIRDIADFFKSLGHSTAEIHLEVIKLQEEQKIKEMQIGIYTSVRGSGKGARAVTAT
jgi:RPA family protein